MNKRRRVRSEDRHLDPEHIQRPIAVEDSQVVASLPLICRHGHVDPRLVAEESTSLGTPVDPLIIPDHDVFRLLYSNGIPPGLTSTGPQ